MNYPIQSEQINELMAALSKAQGEILPAIKDSNNPFFKSKYADLSTIMEACRPALAKNNLAVTQTILPIDEGGRMFLVTTLAHSSGQWVRSFAPIVTQKMDAQSFGSAITYMRRYSLSAIVGVTADEDDDGEKAMNRDQPAQSKPQEKPKKKEIAKITAVQAHNIAALLAQCPVNYQEMISLRMKELGLKSFDDLTPEMHDNITAQAREVIEKLKVPNA